MAKPKVNILVYMRRNTQASSVFENARLLLFMVAEPWQVTTSTSTFLYVLEVELERCVAERASDLACLASSFSVTALRQEVCYYQGGAGPAGPVKIKRRTFHSIFVEADDYVGKLKRLKSDRAAKATLLVREKKPPKKRKRDCRELIVVVPASWQFLDKLEATREDLEEGQIGAALCQWKFWETLNGIPFEVEQDGAHLTSRSYYPKASQLQRMADESLRLVAAALEKLSLNQASQSWPRHLKAPDVFKPDTRDNELKMWSD